MKKEIRKISYLVLLSSLLTYASSTGLIDELDFTKFELESELKKSFSTISGIKIIKKYSEYMIFDITNTLKFNVVNKEGIPIQISSAAYPLPLQSSLLKYIKVKKAFYDDNFFQLIKILKEPKVDEKRKIQLTLPMSIIHNLHEVTYTDEDIKLLEEGKLIKVKHVPAVKYTNKKYIEDWNKHYPESPKEVKIKVINPIIICEIEKAEDKEMIELRIDLGADISILLDSKYSN